MQICGVSRREHNIGSIFPAAYYVGALERDGAGLDAQTLIHHLELDKARRLNSCDALHQISSFIDTADSGANPGLFSFGS
jgi:hypothetical protein